MYMYMYIYIYMCVCARTTRALRARLGSSRGQASVMHLVGWVPIPPHHDHVMGTHAQYRASEGEEHKKK